MAIGSHVERYNRGRWLEYPNGALIGANERIRVVGTETGLFGQNAHFKVWNPSGVLLIDKASRSVENSAYVEFTTPNNEGNYWWAIWTGADDQSQAPIDQVSNGFFSISAHAPAVSAPSASALENVAAAAATAGSIPGKAVGGAAGGLFSGVAQEAGLGGIGLMIVLIIVAVFVLPKVLNASQASRRP